VGAVALLLVLVGSARADLIELYGEERTGSTGGQFLRLPVGARGVAMGGGMTATITGPACVFWNPAAMPTQRAKHGVFASHFEYAAEIDIDHLAYVRRFSSWQLGLGVGILRSGDIERTTELHPTGTGQTFNANQFLGSVSLGRRLTDRFTLAGTLKFLQENLDDYENRAVMVDVGALYFTGFQSSRIGFAVRNFGPDMRINGSPPDEATPAGEWQSFSAPTVAVFGAAIDFGLPMERTLTVSLDFSHPNDEAESILLGSEFDLGRGFALRGGYRSGVSDGGFSGGLGVKIDRKEMPLRLDYGFVDRGSFGVLHTISLEWVR
jgi:hypothetical protein